MEKKAWTTIAHECVEKYNRTNHSITGYAPCYLLYGTDATILPNELRKECIHSGWIRDKEGALSNTFNSHYYKKMFHNRKRKNREFKVGDMVYVENGNKINRKKLEELRIGPYKIVEKNQIQFLR